MAVKLISEFRRTVTEPLCQDIRRVLEVTCHFSGPDNQGSNFLGNLVVLIGIETVARFTNLKTPEEVSKFRLDAEEIYKALDRDKKEFLSYRHEPSMVSGSRLAIDFIKKYFDERFSRTEVNGLTLADIVWKFRNAHSHTFYPFIAPDMRGAVKWFYRNPDPKILEGMTIAEIERNFDEAKDCLYNIHDGWFDLCPQILFVYFKRGILSYFDAVETDRTVQMTFQRNFESFLKSHFI